MSDAVLRGLSQDEFDLLYLSIGSHRTKRPLSPIEVGQYCATAKAAGETINRISKSLPLAGPSMVTRFLRILDLDSRIQHLVDWGESTFSVVGFSTAFEIVAVPKDVHERMVNAVCQYGLTKAEAKSIRQLLERSTRSFKDCVHDVVARRAVLVIREVIVGRIANSLVCEHLGRMLQNERDDLLDGVLHDLYPTVGKVTAKLGDARFTVLGGESVRATIASDPQIRVKRCRPNPRSDRRSWLTAEHSMVHTPGLLTS